MGGGLLLFADIVSQSSDYGGHDLYGLAELVQCHQNGFRINGNFFLLVHS